MAMLEFEKEELEIKNEPLEKAKIDMDDSIEEVNIYQIQRNFKIE